MRRSGAGRAGKGQVKSWTAAPPRMPPQCLPRLKSAREPVTTKVVVNMSSIRGDSFVTIWCLGAELSVAQSIRVFAIVFGCWR
jgi:hypothetical protein